MIMKKKLEQVRFGIVGTGMIAGVHAAAIRQCGCAKLVAACDKVLKNAQAYAQQYSIQIEKNLEGLLSRDDIDAIIITTPSGSRRDIAVAAANAGKHVLCEKPMEVTPDRAQSIIDACRRNNVTLGCVFQARTGKNVQQIRKALDGGRFGKLILVSAQIRWFRNQQYYDSAGWRGTWELDGGGVLMNQSIHIIDLLCYLAGKAKTVFGITDTLTHQNIEVEDTAVAAIKFANGALGVIEASTSCGPGFPRKLEISGERGSAILEDDRLIRWSFMDSNPEDDEIRKQGIEGDDLRSGHADPKAIRHEGHRRIIEDFARAVIEGRDPMIPGTDGKTAVELIYHIYESCRRSRPYDFEKKEYI